MNECPNCPMDHISEIVVIGCVFAFFVTALLLVLLYYNGPTRPGRRFNEPKNMRYMSRPEQTSPKIILSAPGARE